MGSGLLGIIEQIKQGKRDKLAAGEQRRIADFYSQYGRNPDTPAPQGLSRPEDVMKLQDFIRQQTDQRGQDAAFKELAPFLSPSLSSKTDGQMPSQQEFVADASAWAQDKGIDPRYSMPLIEKMQGLKQFEVPADKGFTLTPGQTRFDSQGKMIAEVNKPAGAQSGGIPYFTPVQTANGVYAFDNRSGGISPIDVNGAPVVSSTSDPRLQGTLAAAKASGTLSGKTATQAAIDLPQYVQEADDSIKLIDDMLKHPGMSKAVGKSAMLGLDKVPGTEARSFAIAHNQLMGKQFLQAFQSLKGGGQITEVEGKKATEAMSRMDRSNTEEGFIEAAREFQAIIRKGVERARLKAGRAKPVTLEDTAPSGLPANPISEMTDDELLKALGG